MNEQNSWLRRLKVSLVPAAVVAAVAAEPGASANTCLGRAVLEAGDVLEIRHTLAMPR